MEYTLIRSRRRTLSLSVEGGVAVVRAPMNMQKHIIDEAVQRHISFFEKNLKKSKELSLQRASFCLAYGSRILLLGKECEIACADVAVAVYNNGMVFVPKNLTPDEIKAAIIALYKTTVKSTVDENVAFFSKQLGVCPSSIKITGAATRWGSCSGKNGLCFSWRLAMASPQTLRAVIVHELSHIRHHNHGRAFWQTVYSALPAYGEAAAELKALSARLQKENWQ